MKKFFAILLLLIVPLQFSWAAAGAYCEHEHGKAAQHFGHHMHQHDGQDAQASKDAKDSTSKSSHKDCDYCQHSCKTPLLIQVPQFTAAEGTSFATETLFAYSSHIPEGPRRPDRSAVA